MQITLFLISVIIPSPTAASIGDDITVQKAPLLYMCVRARKSLQFVCIINVQIPYKTYMFYMQQVQQKPLHIVMLFVAQIQRKKSLQACLRTAIICAL